MLYTKCQWISGPFYRLFNSSDLSILVKYGIVLNTVALELVYQVKKAIFHYLPQMSKLFLKFTLLDEIQIQLPQGESYKQFE